MTFDNMQKLQGKSAITFKNISNRFIKDELTTTPEPPMFDVHVESNVRQRRNLRVLQQQSRLLVVFDVVVEFRSVSKDHDISALVGGTWETQEDQDAFIAALKATGDSAFQDITMMMTQINGWDPGNGDDEEEEDFDLFIIIGASVGGAAVLFFVGASILYVRHRRGRAKKKPEKTTNITYATPQPPSSNGDARVSTYVYRLCAVVFFFASFFCLQFWCLSVSVCSEIVVDYQDDISTLGDPMFGAGVAAGGMLLPGMEKDETIAARYDENVMLELVVVLVC